MAQHVVQQLVYSKGVNYSSEDEELISRVVKPWFPTKALEGVDPDDPCTLPRSDLVNLILDTVYLHPTCALRAPPMGGKTSLIALIKRRALEDSRFSEVCHPFFFEN